MKKKLILVISERMDNNKKDDRDEGGLVRMSATTRDYMGFHDDHVELWPIGSTEKERSNKSLFLKIFHAFNDDIKKLKKDISFEEMDENQYKRVGFVTTKTFGKICGGDRVLSDDVWISNDIHNTVIGADPEFLMFDADDAIIYASNVLPHDGEMGSDGAMAEVRPHPEVSVDKLVENMRKIFKTSLNKDNLSRYKLIATCYHEDGNRGYPVGGHIHVGNPVQLISKPDTIREKFYKVTNKIMDEYLTVPLIKIDGADGAKRRDPERTFSGYGYFGDFRTEHGRLEHRSLSGMWLLHPSVSKAVLGTSKAVTDEVFRLVAKHGFEGGYALPDRFDHIDLYNSNFDSWDKIPLTADMGCTESSKWMKSVLNTSNEGLINETYVNKLHNRFKQLSTYESNRRYIDGFCEILKVGYKELSNWDKDIKNNWLGGGKFLVEV